MRVVNTRRHSVAQGFTELDLNTDGDAYTHCSCFAWPCCGRITWRAHGSSRYKPDLSADSWQAKSSSRAVIGSRAVTVYAVNAICPHCSCVGHKGSSVRRHSICSGCLFMQGQYGGHARVAQAEGLLRRDRYAPHGCCAAVMRQNCFKYMLNCLLSDRCVKLLVQSLARSAPGPNPIRNLTLRLHGCSAWNRQTQ